MLDELIEMSATVPGPAVESWKNQGNEVIGLFCSHVPEEIIHAAGILPLRIRATGCTEALWGDVYMSNFSCSFARSCLEFALDGKYDILDGLVATNSCAQMHRLYDNWRFNRKIPFIHFLSVPNKSGDSAIAWYKDELTALRQRLEEHFGIEITDASIAHSIEVCNETRQLLRELYELRKSENPQITGFQCHSLVLAASSMPKEIYNDMLRQSLEEMKSKAPITDYRARLMVIGSSLDDPDFINIIEGLGGLVVTDSCCFGAGDFWEPVQLEVDVLHSLAKSYLNRPNCPRMMDRHEAMFEFIKNMVDEFNVDGIIYQRLRYCDLWGGEALFLENKLKEANIPFLSIERDHLVSSTGQIGTRIEALIEMVKGVM
ncbi:MAG: 2-hydroxyacyl-CoA dehydratase family protein [Chloroflexota bacterium]|nr:2-hydroxyacyl-CoA dehydratase family protein [Chloroflexota bacterium]